MTTVCPRHRMILEVNPSSKPEKTKRHSKGRDRKSSFTSSRLSADVVSSLAAGAAAAAADDAFCQDRRAAAMDVRQRLDVKWVSSRSLTPTLTPASPTMCRKQNTTQALW